MAKYAARHHTVDGVRLMAWDVMVSIGGSLKKKDLSSCGLFDKGVEMKCSYHFWVDFFFFGKSDGPSHFFHRSSHHLDEKLQEFDAAREEGLDWTPRDSSNQCNPSFGVDEFCDRV